MTVRSASVRAMIFLAGLVTILVTFVGPAGAHAGNQSYLFLNVAESTSGRLEMPFGDLREHLGMSLEGSLETIDAEIELNADRLRQYTLDHIGLGDGETVWEVSATEVGRVEEIDYVEVEFTAAVPGGRLPQVFSVQLDPFFDEDPDRDALLVIANDWDRGVVANSEEFLLRFTPSTRNQVVDLGDASRWRNFTASIGLGLDHIKTGPDHILFVAVLLLPSVLVLRNGWKPVESFAGSLWRVLKVVSMFTVAHSITFTLAGLGIIKFPSTTLVEVIIALSIAAAALHNLRPVLADREWVIAFAFGLFHGLGFASLVSDLDVSRGAQLVSLAGRNVGIEIGQAIVVLVVFPLLFVLRRTPAYRPTYVAGSWLLVLISLGWMGERLFDIPEVTSKALEIALDFPRIIVIMAIATLGATAIFGRARKKDALLSP